MTAIEAIRMKQEHEERVKTSREKTWQKIAAMKHRNPELHNELKKAYQKPVRVMKKG